MKGAVLTGVLAFMMLGQQQQQQQAIPDGPTPQTLPGVNSVTPGRGDTGQSSTNSDPNAPQSTLPSTQTPAPPDDFQKEAPEIPETGQGAKAFILPSVQVNFVEVPFTVRADKGSEKGQLVPGLTWRDVRVFENNVRQQVRLWTVDPWPLSVALVIDQSLPFDVMGRVNNALTGLQGSFAPYDEVAVYTYNNGPRQQTDFTGAQSNRLTAVIERSKGPGREAVMGTVGPLSQTTYINGHQFDPNTSPRRNSNSPTQIVPKEVHTLNDAIYMAAQGLRTRPRGRRRIMFVISDGKEQGSTAKYKDVLHYLQTNDIAVYATVTGDSSAYGIGFLDKYHLPFMMRDNILPQYVAATGGRAVSSYREKEIATSFSKIAEEARVRYTVGYYSHEPFIDGKYRKIEVQVMRPNLNVTAKDGYYPTPSSMRTGAAAR